MKGNKGKKREIKFIDCKNCEWTQPDCMKGKRKRCPKCGEKTWSGRAKGEHSQNCRPTNFNPRVKKSKIRKMFAKEKKKEKNSKNISSNSNSNPKVRRPFLQEAQSM